MRCAISAVSRTLAGISRRPNDGAAASIVRRYAVHVGFAGSKTTAILSTLGAHSLSSCSHFPPTENSKFEKPVMLPSGRARLVTKPAATGSTTSTKTIGMERVCCRRAMAASEPEIQPSGRLEQASGSGLLLLQERTRDMPAQTDRRHSMAQKSSVLSVRLDAHRRWRA